MRPIDLSGRRERSVAGQPAGAAAGERDPDAAVARTARRRRADGFARLAAQQPGQSEQFRARTRQPRRLEFSAGRANPGLSFGRAAVPEAGPPAKPVGTRRVEYFHWNERIGGTDFVNEDGALFTLGYSRQIGIERFRAELFGGDVHYDGYDQTGTATMASNTGYLGLRGEYEMVLAPAAWEGRVAFLAGLGTRFWIRDLHDGSDDQGNPVFGYQETWWTIYPYLGLETHLPLGDDMDWYSESRIGTTALTYQFATTGSVPRSGGSDSRAALVAQAGHLCQHGNRTPRTAVLRRRPRRGDVLGPVVGGPGLVSTQFGDVYRRRPVGVHVLTSQEKASRG